MSTEYTEKSGTVTPSKEVEQARTDLQSALIKMNEELINLENMLAPALSHDKDEDATEPLKQKALRGFSCDLALMTEKQTEEVDAYVIRIRRLAARLEI